VATGQREYPGHKGDSVTGHETCAVVGLRAAGGAARREQALLVGVGEPLPVRLAGELGELVHDGRLLPVSGGGVGCVPLSQPARAVTMRNGEQDTHRIAAQDCSTGLSWAARPCPRGSGMRGAGGGGCWAGGRAG
jgi:hypothetical protein